MTRILGRSILGVRGVGWGLTVGVRIMKDGGWEIRWTYDLSGIIQGGGGGVLPYVTLMGTCGPIGYGFQGVLS